MDEGAGIIRDEKRMKRFQLTREHLALLRAANVSMSDFEWGAPGIDPKRPYGSGNLIQSIWEAIYADEILRACADGVTVEEREWDSHAGQPNDITPREWVAERERYEALHKEMETALQIALRHVDEELPPGEYVSSEYGSDWRRADV